jgi:hypothetical protein
MVCAHLESFIGFTVHGISIVLENFHLSIAFFYSAVIKSIKVVRPK